MDKGKVGRIARELPKTRRNRSRRTLKTDLRNWGRCIRNQVGETGFLHRNGRRSVRPAHSTGRCVGRGVCYARDCRRGLLGGVGFQDRTATPGKNQPNGGSTTPYLEETLRQAA